MGPGEEVILHCGPLHDVTTLIVEILYPLSVSGTIVIPPCDTLYNYAKTFKIMKQIHPTLIWGSSKLGKINNGGFVRPALRDSKEV